MVRMGRLESTHSTVQAYNIDVLSGKRMETDKNVCEANKATQDCENKLKELKADLEQVQSIPSWEFAHVMTDSIAFFVCFRWCCLTASFFQVQVRAGRLGETAEAKTSNKGFKEKIRQLQAGISKLRRDLRAGREAMDQAKKMSRTSVLQEANLVV